MDRGRLPGRSRNRRGHRASAGVALAAIGLVLLLTMDRSGYDDSGYVPGWGLPAWSDEFDDDAVDPEKWTVWDRSTHGNLSFDWGDLSDEAVTVEDGTLRLRLTRLDAAVFSGDKERWWRTAALDTMGKHQEPWGRWEIRAKIPTTAGDSRGVWPAFWLRNPPELGEIDIMESWGDPPGRPRAAELTETSTLTLHERTVPPFGERAGWTYEHEVASLAPPYSTASGFHTWAIEYTPTEFVALFDGEVAVHLTPDGADGTEAMPWVWGESFDGPWYMRLNLAMGDPYWTPDPSPRDDATVTPADFVVDYVRYWALPDG